MIIAIISIISILQLFIDEVKGIITIYNSDNIDITIDMDELKGINNMDNIDINGLRSQTMIFKENSVIELKSEVTPDIKKEIIAFANCEGGDIYVGVANDGTIIGVKNTETEMERISQMIQNGIKPDLHAYTSVEEIIEQKKSIIHIAVSVGLKRPYHLSDKGLKSSGVYVRHGITSAPASEEMIRAMIRDSDGAVFDKARSSNQALSFDYAKRYFTEREIPFEQSNMRTLKLVDSDGYFTNAALLLSDQCEHSIKCAVYQNDTKLNFKARKDFFGSVLKQLDESYGFISLNNNLRSTFEGLNRIDVPDYPEYALREALLNTVVHRDYDYSGSTIVNIFSDRIEFVSIGGLVKGITMTDAINGVSQSRNSVLAGVFYRLTLIESYGTGIKRIIESYAPYNLTPKFSPAPASFVATLPNINTSKIKPDQNLTDEEKVLNLMRTGGSISRKDIEDLLGVSSFPANKLLNRLLAEKKIAKTGSARATKYILKSNNL